MAILNQQIIFARRVRLWVKGSVSSQLAQLLFLFTCLLAKVALYHYSVL